MKITASRSEDLRRERDAFDAEHLPYKQRYEAEQLDYRKARFNAENQVVSTVKELIGQTSLNLDIEVYPDYDFKTEKSLYSISVKMSRNGLHDDGRALTWNWEAKLVDGQLVKESGSWSGLRATTQENIEELKESVRVLEILNDIDWEPLITSPQPKSSDYIDPDNARKANESRPNYESMIESAEVEEYIGQNVMIKCNGLSSNRWATGQLYVQLVSETPKFFKVLTIPKSYVESTSSAEELGKLVASYPQLENKNKDAVLDSIVHPLVIREFE